MMKMRELISRKSQRLAACTVAVASACGSQAQTAQQILYTDEFGVVRLQKDAASEAELVPGNLGLGEDNSALHVSVRNPGIRINGDLTLGNVVSNGTTVFKVNESRNTVTGLLSTEGQRLEFTLSPNVTPLSPSGGQNHTIKDGTGSGKINTQSLFMGGTETFGITLSGSVKDGARYRLIESNTAINVNNQSGTRLDITDVTSQGRTNCQVCRVTDNSFVITSRVYVESESDGAWRYVTFEASRTSDVYITKSNSLGHFSNNAAYTLGTIAKNGYQLGDLTTAITTIDLDSYGYGHTMEHLAVQAKRLAPIANNSYIRSALAVSDLLSNVLDDRLISLRRDGPGRDKGNSQRFWVQPFGNKAKQSGLDDYDGYRLTTTGLSMGYDHALDDAWIGASFSAADSRIDQLNFRAGDASSINSLMFRLYAAKEISTLYVDGSLGSARHDYSGSRRTAIDRVARDGFTSTDLHARFGVGYRIKLKDPRSVLVPYMNVAVSRISQPEYTETTAGDLGLTYDAKNFHRIRSVLGVRYNTESRIGSSHSFTTMHVAWGREKGLGNLDIKSRYSGPTPAEYTGFITPASKFDRSLVSLGLSSTIALSEAVGVKLGTELEHRRGYNSVGVQAKALWVF